MKVSVLFLCSNHEAFVAQALQSALQQDYPEYELVIHDDGSTDSTNSIVMDILSKGVPAHIKIVFAGDKKNHGLLEAFNRAFAVCTGDVAVIFSGDDISHPNRLSRHIDIYQKHPDVMLVFSAVDRINQQGSFYKNDIHLKTDTLYSHEDNPNDIYAGADVLGAAASYRKDAFRNFKPFMAKSAHAEDNILWVRALILGKIYYLKERLVLYRLHEQNFSDTAGRWANGLNPTTQKKHIETLQKYGLNSLQWIEDIDLALKRQYIPRATAKRFTKLAHRHALRWQLLAASLKNESWNIWFMVAFNAAKHGGFKKCISMLIMRLSERRKNWYWQRCVKRAQLEIDANK